MAYCVLLVCYSQGLFDINLSKVYKSLFRICINNYQSLYLKQTFSSHFNYNQIKLSHMKKRLLLALCFLFWTSIGTAQTRVNVAPKGQPFLKAKPDTIIKKLDKQSGLEHWTITNNKRQVLEMGTVLKEKRMGMWIKLYQPDSMINSITEYVADKKQGLAITFSKRGQIILEENYANDELHGWKRGYTEVGHKINLQEKYVNGRVEGLQKIYAKDGKLQEEHFFKNGKKNGVSKTYYPDGKVKQEISYKDDVKNGSCKWFHKNGQLMTEYMYTQGGKTGTFKAFFESGELKSEITFLKSIKNGPYLQYFKNKKIKIKGTYKEDKKDGEWVYSNEEGKVTTTKVYKAGELMEVK